jgi:hypothetical protein
MMNLPLQASKRRINDGDAQVAVWKKRRGDWSQWDQKRKRQAVDPLAVHKVEAVHQERESIRARKECLDPWRSYSLSNLRMLLPEERKCHDTIHRFHGCNGEDSYKEALPH